MAIDQEILRARDVRAVLREITRHYEEIKAVRSGAPISQAPGTRTGPQTFPGTTEQGLDLRTMATPARRMNWIHRFGDWWDGRRVIRRHEFEEFTKSVLRVIEEDHKSNVAAETVKLKLRVDQLELFVGLKREPKPQEVPGAPRIS